MPREAAAERKWGQRHYLRRVNGRRQHLSPEALARRERAQQHVDEFVGLSLVEAQRHAAELDLPLKVVRPDGVMSLELMFGRVIVTVDEQDRVVKARA